MFTASLCSSLGETVCGVWTTHDFVIAHVSKVWSTNSICKKAQPRRIRIFLNRIFLNKGVRATLAERQSKSGQTNGGAETVDLQSPREKEISKRCGA